MPTPIDSKLLKEAEAFLEADPQKNGLIIITVSGQEITGVMSQYTGEGMTKDILEEALEIIATNELVQVAVDDN